MRSARVRLLPSMRQSRTSERPARQPHQTLKSTLDTIKSENMPPERASKACLRCRKKKRRCNGRQPCRNCTNAHQECTYSSSSSQRPSPSEIILNEASVPHGGLIAEKRVDKCASLNSGDLLVKRLGLSTDSDSPSVSRLCSWNFRLRKDLPCLSVVKPLSDILTPRHMHQLADIFFAEIHPVYKFLDPDIVYGVISTSFDQPPETPSSCILSGVAALACLFHRSSPELESQIIYHARTSLEYSTTLAIPTVEHVVGWLLRVIYLRFTSPPNATWLASCILMHMIEPAKRHLSTKTNINSLADTGQSYSPQLQDQIFYTAQLFNTWISYDYGQPRIIPRGVSHSIPSESSEWTKTDHIFWKLSDSLDPNLQIDSTGLENMLDQTIQLQPLHPALQLKGCNIGLCIYRRLRVTKQVISNGVVDQILQLADEGMRVATAMAKTHSPWWHVLNVPFQILCVMLAIDTKASLERVNQTFQTLKLLADEYGAEAVHETWLSACTLLRLQTRNKKEEFEILDHVGNDFLSSNLGEGERVLPDLSLPVQTIDEANYDLGGFLELDEVFSTNLFAL